MAIQYNSSDAFEKLREIFPDIPENCIELTIKLNGKGPVVVEECSFYPTFESRNWGDDNGL